MIMYAIKKLEEKRNVTAICAVIVGTKGNKPKRFDTKINKNILKIHGNNVYFEHHFVQVTILLQR